MRAYLFAADDAPSDVLRAKKQQIRALGWKCVPIVHEGKPALEVRGFKNADELTVALHRLGITGAVAGVTADEGDKRSRKDKLSNATLKLAGFSYLIGDGSYIWYRGAPLIKDWKHLAKGFGGPRFFGIVDVVAGLGYMLGSLSLARYGSRDQSINTITAATQKIERFSRKEGLEISPETSLAYTNEIPDRTIWGNVDHFIGKYPSEVFNSIYVGVGACITAAALYHGTRPIANNLVGEELRNAIANRHSARIDVGLGMVTASSALTGLLLKETKPLPGDEKRSGVGGVIDWIREKPLRATGIGYMIATGVHAVSTLQSKEPAKFLIGRWIFIVTNIFSEIMLALSSKGHGAGVKPDDSVDKSVIGATAELILRQPLEKREALIENMAGYMASREVLGVKAEKIAAELRSHINLLDNNPWTKHYVPNQKGEMQEVETHATAKEIEQEHMLQADAPGNKIQNVEYVAKQQPLLTQGVSA